MDNKRSAMSRICPGIHSFNEGLLYRKYRLQWKIPCRFRCIDYIIPWKGEGFCQCCFSHGGNTSFPQLAFSCTLLLIPLMILLRLVVWEYTTSIDLLTASLNCVDLLPIQKISTHWFLTFSIQMTMYVVTFQSARWNTFLGPAVFAEGVHMKPVDNAICYLCSIISRSHAVDDEISFKILKITETFRSLESLVWSEHGFWKQKNIIPWICTIVSSTLVRQELSTNVM